MIRFALAAALLCALFTMPAEARPKHRKAVQADCGFFFCPPVETGRATPRRRDKAAGYFIRGRLVCARNVNAELARRGIKGTGSAWAKSFLKWGRPSGPVKGAVAVFNRGKRGGHVAIVHHVDANGNVYYLNPSSRRQAWQIGPYRKKPIAFRVAGW